MSTIILPSLYSQDSHSIVTTPKSVRKSRSHAFLLGPFRSLLPRPIANLEYLATGQGDISRRAASTENGLKNVKALLHVKLSEVSRS